MRSIYTEGDTVGDSRPDTFTDTFTDSRHSGRHSCRHSCRHSGPGAHSGVESTRIISSLVFATVMALAPLASVARISPNEYRTLSSGDNALGFIMTPAALPQNMTPAALPHSATPNERLDVKTPAAFAAPAINTAPGVVLETSLDPIAPKAHGPDIEAILLPTPRPQEQGANDSDAGADAAESAAESATEGALKADRDRTAELEHIVASPPKALPKDDDLVCLAAALYHEARNQAPSGRMAVAATIMNRAALKPWPETICGVIAQPKQFSFIQGGRRIPRIAESDAWAVAVGEAAMILMVGSPPQLDGVAYYHTAAVKPAWRKGLKRVAQIGDHIFYTNRK